MSLSPLLMKYANQLLDSQKAVDFLNKSLMNEAQDITSIIPYFMASYRR